MMQFQDLNGHLWDANVEPVSRICVRDECVVTWDERSALCNVPGADTARVLVKEQTEVIREWWTKTAEADTDKVVAKAEEYGAADLLIMGKAMESLLPGNSQMDRQSLEQAGLEMALAFYALGKVARAFGAYARGSSPADDSWYDLGVYANMARFVREHGRWM